MIADVVKRVRKARKKYPHKCATKFCRGLVHESTHHSICQKCKWKKFREQHPIKYFYWKLKYRARERGHSFTLTFEEYEAFAKSSGYMENKGKTAQSLSIDRIDDSKGYSADNIRAVTLSFNSRRQYVQF